MNKLLYLITIITFSVLCTGTVNAQYHITSCHVTDYPDSFCTSPELRITTNLFGPSLSVQTIYGDGTSDVHPLSNVGGTGFASYYHTYTSSGTYTVKQVLFDGATPVDSLYGSYYCLMCHMLCIRGYFDLNSNCIWDSLYEQYFPTVTYIVDSNGIAVDTFEATWGLDYQALGNPGDIYAFHIYPGVGASVACPASGVIYDTLTAIVYSEVKYIGFVCMGSPNYNTREIVNTYASGSLFSAQILTIGTMCTINPDTLTINLSPKYTYGSILPAPYSISGNTYKWSLPALGYNWITISGNVVGSPLVIGDTVHSSYYLTVPATDTFPSDNTVIVIDTITGPWDPNDKAVVPQGFIAAGSGIKLTYTIRFENTGNDTAFNIHIMDTLSDNLNIRSLEVLGSSARMTMGVTNDGSYNIVKFDFPHINLLDSSHHGQCDGMVTYTIKTKDGLPVGTHIDNNASIYFDYNLPVVTNTVTNIVGWPAGIADMSNVVVSDVQLFPNPAENELNVKISKGTFNTISVINSVGQVVMKQDVNGTSTQLNVKGLPAGGYYISVKGNSGVKVERFQKM